MITQLRRTLAVLLVFLLAAMTAPSASAPPLASGPARTTEEPMSDALMSAFLAASSRPFTATAGGYRARSGGLDVTLDASGLQANLGGLAWGLALRALGREGQMSALPEAQIVQADGRLEYRRGALTEWYRDTPLGVEQGFTIHQPPRGAGALILHLELSTDLTGEADTDGRGLSFAAPDGQTLRYDHLRAWDADDTSLEARLSYVPGQMTLRMADRGATYPVTIDPLIYHQQQVVASDGEANDDFGYSVALWGDTALVGAPADGVATYSDQGSAYVFTRSGTTWSEQAHLTASDGEANDGFGWSVALWEDTALVGAPYDDVGTYSLQGSAYVFTRSGTTWSEQAHLTASDGTPEDLFGSSVALWGDTALVGAYLTGAYQGSAYVFARAGTTWSEQAHLTPSDGGTMDEFGLSVALWDDTALVGAPGHRVGEILGQGSAYVFTRTGTTWSEQAHLTASDGAAHDNFGGSVALWGDTALVGAPYDDVGADGDQGSAYVFARSGTTWTEQAHLTALNGAQDDWSGFAVALWGDTALVGARRDDVGANGDQGSAYVFTRSGTVWSEQVHLTAADGAAGDWFGASVALWDDTALVGAPRDTIGANSGQGSAYLYDAFPTVTAITRSDPNPTQASSVRFAVTFSEDVTGVDPADFLPSATGAMTGTAVTTVSGSGATYTVTVSTGSGMGTLRLDVPASATITDLAGNPLSGLPYTSGEAYRIAYVIYLPVILRTVP